ncbi:DUF2017 family protein [Leucobacter viscericola]|uniref:DUF2017 family protein n=1 Tax=Leucobacter viscericola TaxID=2714935 RepID=A0A6G7XCN9_9MICO|nr:DUF2017 family protein [Leucobacter viscericola]QIK62209.1 DUF2017 family protein [Leucobacter viscericola]
MKLQPLPEGGLRLLLNYDEAAMLDQLITQLMQLLQSHSGTALDPDPLFASLEIGGSEEVPEDPALARLFPNAYEGDEQSSQFRRVTEQGLLNRKLQDAAQVSSALGLGGGLPDEDTQFEVDILASTLPAWVKTITALRLAIAARIGLNTAEDHDRLLSEEETRGTVLVFDWLAAILESALMMRLSRDEDDEASDGVGSTPV